MSGGFKNPEWLRRLPHYLYYRDVYRGRHVLELDCQDGTSAEFLARHGARHVIGIDTSSELIEDAFQKYALPNLEFHCTDYGQTGFADGEFECVMVPNGLDVLRRSDRLAELKRVLHPNGTLVLKAPSSDGRTPRGQGATFYEFVERLEPVFGTVRMAAQSPFVGMSVVEYGGSTDDPDPEFELETDLSELGRGVDVLDYVAVCGRAELPPRAYSLMQLPSEEGVDMLMPALAGVAIPRRRISVPVGEPRKNPESQRE